MVKRVDEGKLLAYEELLLYIDILRKQVVKRTRV
jgi:hypothetical protein